MRKIPEELIVLGKEMVGLMVEIRELREDKREMAAEAKKYAEEAGRLAALLHDAQRDAERYRWLRDNAPDTWNVSVEIIEGVSECCLASQSLDESIDAAMAKDKGARG
ncbi:hypothetical protein [Xanthomonas albilineans]|uniref:hypothetical protein n=1 Tax=Xanthomonas albilineans TaxID=29447 RepID=UPI0005F33737|nr:hypothetical protein [Xanthomonas albilineans]